MKTLQMLLAAGLLVGVAPFAGANEAKPKSYTLHGFWSQGKPPDELVQQAAKAVEKQMAGMTLIGAPEDADHNVEVLFRRDSFKIYVDALPLSGMRVGTAPLPFYPTRIDYSMEKADSERSQPR